MSGSLSLSGTTVEFGTLQAQSLDVAGTVVLAAGGQVAESLSIGAQGLVDFAQTLAFGGAAPAPGLAVLSLASGAVLVGDGTLQAGNLAVPGLIEGPGTLFAPGGGTLQVDAAGITGAALNVGGGGVLVLAPEAGSLAVDGSVTVAFGTNYGVVPIAGGYADTLGQDGGVLVLDDPRDFAGTLLGFAPGDRLILPGLTDISVSGVGGQSFTITGTDSANQLESATFNAALPTGAVLTTGTDAAGDAEIGLAPAAAEFFLNGGALGSAAIQASAGVGQALPGLELLLPGWTGQSLTVTLRVGQGTLDYGTVAPAAALTLTAASPAALNALLAGLVYTAALSAGSDQLTLSGGGILSGISAVAAISVAPGGTVSGFTVPPTGEQTVLFTGNEGNNLITQAAAPGEVVVTSFTDFADLLEAGGIGGTALAVDGGGSGIFDAAATVLLSGDAVIGDANGPGTLAVLTRNFTIHDAGGGGNLVIGGSGAAAGSLVEITGAASVAGAVLLGPGAGLLEVAGSLAAQGATIGAAGTLVGTGNATLALGLVADAGTVELDDAAAASAQQLVLGGLLALQGSSALAGLSGAVIAAGGSLVIGTGATFSANGLNAQGGSVLDQGTVQIAGALVSDAQITLAGGTLAAGAATLAGGGTLAGFGTVVASGAGATIGLSGGEILAEGGLLELDGHVTVSGGASIVITGSSALALAAAAGGAISFSGAGAMLTITNPAAELSAVTGMVAGDVIDLVGINPGYVSDAAGTLSIRNGGGQSLGGFSLGVAPEQPAVEVLADGNGGALITLGGQMACFVLGTRLLTPAGYVPVEAFKPGDPIITRLGARRPVRWIGRRTVETGPDESRDVCPVTVLPGAFGPGVPARTVRLSPSHAVFLDDVLVPVMHLVNGVTILREPRRGQVRYFHVELDRHEVLMADGLAVESYLDTGNRGEFRHESGQRGKASVPCAPLVSGGAKLARIRRKLHEITLRAGFSVVDDPELHGMAGERRLVPEFSRRGAARIARFALPPGTGRLLLLARGAAPAETDPESDDRRELSVCSSRPQAVVADAAGQRTKLRRPGLGAGWYSRAAGDAGIWMGGCGEILLPPGALELRLSLIAVARRWRRPVDLDGQAL